MLVLQVVVFFAIASLPVVSVAALLAAMRLWRRLLALGGVCGSIFGLLFLLVIFLVSQREPVPGNAEPPIPLAGGLLYAAILGVIACDFAALLGIPLLFAGGVPSSREPAAGHPPLAGDTPGGPTEEECGP
ncbi:MAG: hypothetical protein C0506_13665 [Anaerolinea sp.]|nr:hypothetical protein [Anaerolinea sp.]